MKFDAKTVVRWLGAVMGEAHRGVLPQGGKLVAFGNRGQAEVADFRKWLGKRGYSIQDYATEDDSWVMLIEPPTRMKDTRAITKALWDASPDGAFRKAVQFLIADLHLRLVFARQCLPLDRSWFTKREVRGLAAFLGMVALEDLGIPEEKLSLATPGGTSRLAPSLN